MAKRANKPNDLILTSTNEVPQDAVVMTVSDTVTPDIDTEPTVIVVNPDDLFPTSNTTETIIDGTTIDPLEAIDTDTVADYPSIPQPWTAEESFKFYIDSALLVLNETKFTRHYRKFTHELTQIRNFFTS